MVSLPSPENFFGAISRIFIFIYYPYPQVLDFFLVLTCLHAYCLKKQSLPILRGSNWFCFNYANNALIGRYKGCSSLLEKELRH